jgi:hypothetical protein
MRELHKRDLNILTSQPFHRRDLNSLTSQPFQLSQRDQHVLRRPFGVVIGMILRVALLRRLAGDVPIDGIFLQGVLTRGRRSMQGADLLKMAPGRLTLQSGALFVLRSGPRQHFFSKLEHGYYYLDYYTHQLEQNRHSIKISTAGRKNPIYWNPLRQSPTTRQRRPQNPSQL